MNSTVSTTASLLGSGHNVWSNVIVAHTVVAVAALLLGAFVLGIKKGSTPHRYGGRVWVLLMACVAISSFWIKTSGSFSWIHLLSIGTLISLAVGVAMVRLKKINHHRRWMKNTYFGGLIIAGAFTLLPGRLIGQWLWG
jgi:uncharacterized membrane protein